MALKKQINTPTDQVGSVIRLCYRHYDPITRDSSAHFYLYAKETTDKTKPMGLVAKLRLTGDAYDKYLGKTALDTIAAPPGNDPIGTQLYRALKAESAASELTLGCELKAGLEMTRAQLGSFADALDI